MNSLLKYQKSIIIILAIFSCLSVIVFGVDESDEFNIAVEVKCVGATMTVRVNTHVPFHGIIHTKNRTEPGCSVRGRGELDTDFKIDLSKQPGTTGSCGVVVDKRTGEKSAYVSIHHNPIIELLQDRRFKVTCGNAGFRNSRDEISVVQLRVAVIGDEEKRISTALEGERYKLRAEVIDHDEKYGISVRRCYAFDDTDSSLKIIDERGCPIQKLISSFEFDNALGTADAIINSMFQLGRGNKTYFQCDVVICSGECEKVSCENSVDFKASNKNGLSTKNVDPFVSTMKNTVTVSTSVIVASPGSPGSVLAAKLLNGDDVYSDNHSQWLLYLCIVFGVLFGVMLLINIFLCTAMTCSCTKSEIIEKEPSIYDDYSIYDSQYGYTNNGKVYGSGSEYGSDYGIVGNTTANAEQHSGIQRSEMHSESGSRYGQHINHPTNRR